MNVEQNTGNAEKLPLHERAARGLLLPKPELSLAEILALEHPTDLAARNALGAAMRAAIDYGDLVARKDKTPPRTVRRSSAFWPAGSWSLGNGDPPDRLVTYPGTVTKFIDREDYRAWRNACPAELLLPPPLSKIQKWLGATPPAESIAPVETSLPELPASTARPATVAKGGAAGKEAALLALLDEVDKRAAEQDAGFNRDSLPGTKAEFHELLNAYCPAFRYIGLPAVSDYLKGKCKFQRGVNPKNGKGAAVWALFPEYSLKLG